MTEDDRKLYLQVLLEIQKQNQDVSKTVSTLLIPLISAFVTAASAIFIIGDTSKFNINSVNEPYIITVLLTLQIFVLWDAQWRAGYQQHTEERINTVLGKETVNWEISNNTPEKWRSTPSTSFNAVMVIILVFAFIDGVRALPSGVGLILHIIGYSLLVRFLISGYQSVFHAKNRGYNFSKHGIDSSDEEISKRAYLIWEKNGRPFGKEIEHWEQAKYLIREQIISSRTHFFSESSASELAKTWMSSFQKVADWKLLKTTVKKIFRRIRIRIRI